MRRGPTSRVLVRILQDPASAGDGSLDLMMELLLKRLADQAAVLRALRLVAVASPAAKIPVLKPRSAPRSNGSNSIPIQNKLVTRFLDRAGSPPPGMLSAGWQICSTRCRTRFGHPRARSGSTPSDASSMRRLSPEIRHRTVQYSAGALLISARRLPRRPTLRCSRRPLGICAGWRPPRGAWAAPRPMTLRCAPQPIASPIEHPRRAGWPHSCRSRAPRRDHRGPGSRPRRARRRLSPTRPTGSASPDLQRLHRLLEFLEARHVLRWAPSCGRSRR